MSRVAYIATVVSSPRNTPPVDYVRKIIFDDSNPESIEFELTVALHNSLGYKENTVHIISSTATPTNHSKLFKWLRNIRPNIEFKWFNSTQEYMDTLTVCPAELHDDVHMLWRFYSFVFHLFVSEIGLRSNLPTQLDAMINYLLNSVRYELPTKLFSVNPPRYIPQTASLLVQRWETWNLAMNLYDCLLPYNPPLYDHQKLVNWLVYVQILLFDLISM